MNKDLLLNPFSRIAGGKALAWGLAGIALSIGLGYALDVHCTIFNFWYLLDTPGWLIVVERLVIWLMPTVLLWLAGVWLSRSRVRALDVFGTMAFAQLPVVGLTLAGWPYALWIKGMHASFGKFVGPGWLGAMQVVGSVVSVLCFAWWLAWMFQAFRVSCNLKGGRLWGAFLAVMAGCYVLSKLLLFWLATLK